MKVLMALAVLIYALSAGRPLAYASTYCPPKPAPPIGYGSRDAQCVVKDGMARWVWTRRFSYRCPVKPAPPPGLTSDQAACQCDDTGCQWVFIRQ